MIAVVIYCTVISVMYILICSCKANVSVMQILDNAAPSSCEMESRPSLSAAMINVFAFFFAGIVFSSWSWTKASLEVWERLYRRYL
jgi:hypothetical protein